MVRADHVAGRAAVPGACARPQGGRYLAAPSPAVDGSQRGNMASGGWAAPSTERPSPPTARAYFARPGARDPRPGEVARPPSVEPHCFADASFRQVAFRPLTPTVRRTRPKRRFGRARQVRVPAATGSTAPAANAMLATEIKIAPRPEAGSAILLSARRSAVEGGAGRGGADRRVPSEGPTGRGRPLQSRHREEIRRGNARAGRSRWRGPLELPPTS